jgi:membrane protease subunit HflC
MEKLRNVLIAIAVLVVLLSKMLFTLDQTERAIIIRLGEFIKTGDGKVKILGPGLHFKIPFMDRIVSFDVRLHTTDIPSQRVVTNEKKDLIVDLFVQWRIIDYPLFYNKTRSVSPDVFLQQNTVDILRSEFGTLAISNIVSGDRQKLLEKLISATEINAKNVGIELVDIRIKRIDYPKEINETVYESMRSDRKKDATELRANGSLEAEKIRAKADAEAQVILAEAEKKAAKMRGEGEASAAETYANSYGKAPEFFKFYRSLEAYKKLIQEQDVLILKPEGEFFKYFKSMDFKEATANTKDSKEP